MLMSLLMRNLKSHYKYVNNNMYPINLPFSLCSSFIYFHSFLLEGTLESSFKVKLETKPGGSFFYPISNILIPPPLPKKRKKRGV